MVKAIINIEDYPNRVLNIVKAKENLKDKSEVINLVLEVYGREILGEELNPEFVTELLKAQNEETVEIEDWNKHFGLN